ncbi:VanZ family protein [Galactobacter valiniphilus]|uniref:VanZ family protein n=1 Tax=Galactobacter valiniphilus TaxID=2676122 RepID=A0A399JAH6_9MICC|nr:VanZ family protein [Galactobacter valiniphilus]RII42224.1 VanZ family protein [Galactobacter valiniphilus]
MSNMLSVFGWLIVPTLALCALLAVMVILVRQRRPLGRRPSWSLTIGFWLLCSWALCVLVLTLLSGTGCFDPEALMCPSASFTLFEGWLDQEGWNPVAIRETGLNVALFVPGGFLLRCVSKAASWKLVLGLVFGGLGIELLQALPLVGRVFSLTDIVAYALGAVVGVGLGALLLSGIRAVARRPATGGRAPSQPA